MEEKQNKGEREKLAESFVMWVKNVAWTRGGTSLDSGSMTQATKIKPITQV